tara:strand:- start:248 stop:628 length:381 start_codon:yes stop_codon:yes gene_type:complete
MRYLLPRNSDVVPKEEVDEPRQYHAMGEAVVHHLRQDLEAELMTVQDRIEELTEEAYNLIREANEALNGNAVHPTYWQKRAQGYRKALEEILETANLTDPWEVHRAVREVVLSALDKKGKEPEDIV